MIVAAFIVLGSAYNQDLKGLVLIFGAALTMMIGNFLSGIHAFRRAVPKEGQLLDACSMFYSEGWGVQWSSPGPNALFLSFVTVYMLLPMVVNNDYNGYLLGLLLIIMISNAKYRMDLMCCDKLDIVYGWLMGMLFGLGWYLLAKYIEGTEDKKSGGFLSLTYFNGKSARNVCRVSAKKFKCRKV